MVPFFWLCFPFSPSLFFFFFLFTAAPAACGSSRARGQIGAAAVAIAPVTAMLDPSRICDLHAACGNARSSTH